jgi:ribose transport system substrate-binding protein
VFKVQRTAPRRGSTSAGPKWLAGAAFVISACVSLLVAVGVASAKSSAHTAKASPKLIAFTLPFACGLNSYGEQLCAGVQAEAKKLQGFKVEIKTGTNYADTTAYNNLLQTTYQLKPGGVIGFVDGPDANTPTLLAGCKAGIKVVLIDSPAKGMGKCQSSFVGSDHYGMGVADAQYLIKHPPSGCSKQFAVATQPPGEFASTDARVSGFEKTMKKAGWKLVATSANDDVLNDVQTAVTNVITAHPTLCAVFGANGGEGDGAIPALASHPGIALVTLDGDTAGLQGIKNGTVLADTVQDPYAEGRLAVENLAKVIEHQKVPAVVYTPMEVVTKANLATYLKKGLH